MTLLKVKFENFPETFIIEKLGGLFADYMYWVIDDEKSLWYHRSGVSHSTMEVREGKVRFIYDGGERHGRVV